MAHAADVSVATVSRAVRGLPNVADSTRARVLGVADRLDYRPDPAAARLAAGRTGTLTVAVPSLNGWYFSNVVAGAEAVAAEAGLEVQVIGISSTADRDRLFDESHRLERRTDALILVDVIASPPQVESLTRRDVGIATVGSHFPGYPGVRIDDEHVGRIAGEHLCGIGHRDLAIIGGLPSDPMNPLVAESRKRGFHGVLKRYGIEDLAIASGDFGVDGGHEAMDALLGADRRPTAVFALSDEMAFGAIMALHDRGLEPGVDIALMGVDDHEFSRVVDLTTVRQPVAEHGATAARMLLSTMEPHLDRRDAPPSSPCPTDAPVVPDVELVVRATTAPAVDT
ncbi:MAG: LacI family DNA-binding transcriptional regulator [Ilumatobacter sp.]